MVDGNVYMRIALNLYIWFVSFQVSRCVFICTHMLRIAAVGVVKACVGVLAIALLL